MGRLQISVNGQTREVPLARSSLLGRHGICHAVITHRDVPLHWLEVRWLHHQWAWRALHEDTSRTRGAGKVLGDGWRVLGVGLQGGKVSCGQEVWVKLIDASRPPCLPLISV